MKCNEMKKKNGTTEYNGKGYILTQQAYLDYNANRDEYYYTAAAICESDNANEDGWQPCDPITWAVIADDEDESNNADWDNPENVVGCGEYNENDGRIC